MFYLGNAFSLGMLTDIEEEVTLKVIESDTKTIRSILETVAWQSCIGHQATADLLTTLLNLKVEANRISVKLSKGDVLVVFQLLQRLEEGKVLNKEELQNLNYKFYIVKVV